MRYPFRIPIGDWSKDGHGQCEWFTATAAVPIAKVRESFFATVQKFPDLDPQTICCDYGNGVIKKEVRAKLFKLGAPIGEEDDFGPEEMADLVIWFLNYGDPSLDVKLDESKETPMLPFYGFDKKKRHIRSFGYGLFTD